MAEARRYSLEFEARSRRDEAAISARNRTMLDVILRYLHGRKDRAAIWDLTNYLLVRGHYQSALAPDPLNELAQPELLKPLLATMDFPEEWLSADGLLLAGLLEDFNSLFMPYGLVERLITGFGGSSDFDPWSDEPEAPSLIAELPQLQRRQPSEQTAHGQGSTFLLRVTHRDYPNVWRDLLPRPTKHWRSCTWRSRTRMDGITITYTHSS